MSDLVKSANKCPQVSVVMPVYNSERYLPNAVQSILGQSFEDFELILVDDGSGDGSAAVCDRFALEDSRVVVVHRHNGGICAARNTALDVACGAYVAFSDNDDKCLPGFLEDNVRAAKETGADVVRFLREHRIELDGEVIRSEVLKPSDEPLRVTSITMVERYFQLQRFGGGVWTGLYRREIIERAGIRFPIQMRFGFEDVYFNLLVMYATTSFYVNPRVYYQWTDRFEHSTSRKFSPNRLESVRMCLRMENRVNYRYGISRRTPVEWAAYLVDAYVVRTLQQLSLPFCDLTWKQKCDELRRLAEEPAMREALPNLDVRSSAVSPKTRLVAFLLRRRRFGTLIRLFTLNARREKRVY